MENKTIKNILIEVINYITSEEGQNDYKNCIGSVRGYQKFDCYNFIVRRLKKYFNHDDIFDKTANDNIKRRIIVIRKNSYYFTIILEVNLTKIKDKYYIKKVSLIDDCNENLDITLEEKFE